MTTKHISPYISRDDEAKRLWDVSQNVSIAVDDLRWILDELAKAREDASSSWECLEMVREVFAALEGEERAKGIAPMFFPEAIRSFMFRAAKGEFDSNIPQEKRAEVYAAREELRQKMEPDHA